MRPDLIVTNGELSPELLAGLLGLVGEELPVCVEQWSDLERRIVADWAGREHLAASDNLNRRRGRPHVLDCGCRPGEINEEEQ